MDDFTVSEPYKQPRRKRSAGPALLTLLAWLVIVGIVGYIVAQPYLPRPESPPGEDKLGLVLMTGQSKYLVGASQLPLPNIREEMAEQLHIVNTGSIGQRLRYVVLVGEFNDPGKVLIRLEELQEKLTATDEIDPNQSQQRLMNILGRLYDDYENDQYDAPSVSADQRMFLKAELGWFGDLALNPPGAGKTPARSEVIAQTYRSIFAFVGGVLWFGLVGLAGFVGLIVMIVRLCIQQVRGGLVTPSGFGGMYIETFAIWMLLFLGLGELGGRIQAGNSQLVVSGVLTLLSLLALLWPWLRGVCWKQLRSDIGWVAGRQPLAEPFAGVAGYAMTLPLLAVGVAIILIAMVVITGSGQLMGGGEDDFGPSGGPAHPIVTQLGNPTWWTLLQIYFVASIAAPVVEETMFRGVLYRHLRDASCAWGIAGSVIFSTTVSSFIFAAIHPQGMLAVPALMALAIGFALLREWRVSLIPAMIAHGLSNAVVMTLAVMFLSS